MLLDGVDLLVHLVKHLAVVKILLGAGEFLRLGVQEVLIDVAQGHAQALVALLLHPHRGPALPLRRDWGCGGLAVDYGKATTAERSSVI